eukprot:1786563-Amphidinium_carterae.1
MATPYVPDSATQQAQASSLTKMLKANHCNRPGKEKTALFPCATQLHTDVKLNWPPIPARPGRRETR